MVHPYDDADVIAGQGTIGLEISDQLSAMGLVCDRVLACAGGGGLMTGILLGISDRFPDVTVHPVEPEGYDDYGRSLAVGKICDADASKPSVCDSILAPRPGNMSFAIGAKRLGHGLVISSTGDRLHLVPKVRCLCCWLRGTDCFPEGLG